MKRKTIGFMIILFMLITVVSCGGGGGSTAIPVDKTLSVVVKDSSGNPLPNVNVMANGSLAGTTNNKGELILNKDKYLGKVKMQVMSNGVPLFESETNIDDSTVSCEVRATQSDSGSGSGNTPPGWEGKVKLSGYVKDAEDKTVVIANASLLLAGNNGMVFFANSELDGNYKFYDIPNGDYKLVGLKIGFDVSVSDVKIIETGTTQDVFLTNNGTVPTNGYSLSGVVKDTSGKLLANAYVELFLQPEPYVYYDTNGDGDSTNDEQYASGKDNQNDSKANEAPQPLPEDPRFGPNGGMNNHNWNSNQRNASEDSSGNSSSPSFPGCMPSIDYYRFTKTNEKGEYSFDKVFAVSGDIYVNAEDYRPDRESINFVGKSEHVVNFELEPIVYTSLSGKVSNKDTSVGIANASVTIACVDERFMPMPATDANTNKSNSEDNTTYSADGCYGPGGDVRPGVLGFYTTTTDSDGNYKFDKVPTGKYFGSVYAEKYESYGTELELAETANTFNFDLVELAYCTVSGRVVDSEGKPIEGAFVNSGFGPICWSTDDVAWGANGTRSAASASTPNDTTKPTYDEDNGLGKYYDITDQNGYYTIELVPVNDGKSYIMASAERYIMNGIDIVTEKNKTITASDIVLHSLWDTEVVVSGTVTDVTGKAIPDAYVWAIYETTDSTFAPMVILDDDYTDQNGNYRLRVPKGSIVISCAHPAYDTYNQSYFANNDENNPNILNITLSYPADVTQKPD